MIKKNHEIFGWYGVVAILSAYVLISFSIVNSNNIWYHILNGTGALGIILDSISKRDYQPGVLNAIWLIIALISIVKILI